MVSPQWSQGRAGVNWDDMLAKLPAWVISNEESVRREAEPYRDLTVEQRLDLVRRACADAMLLLAMRPDRQAALDHEDPLPESTRQALARLRKLP